MLAARVLTGQYPRRRRTTATTCAICGEVHDGKIDECPWDLFAQGRGPRPARDQRRPSAEVPIPDPSESVDVEARPDPSVPDLEFHRPSTTPWPERSASSTNSPRCPSWSTRSRVAGALAGEGELVDGVRELIEHLRFQAEAIVPLVDRLERIAGHR